MSPGEERRGARPSVSAVVPVYNGAQTLEPLVGRLEAVLGPDPSRFEIILVNDGSRDASWQVIRRLAESRPAVRGIDLMRNYGQHNALLRGIRCARHEVIVTLDDDLQNPPEEIPKLLDKLAEGHDVVYGTPEVRRQGLWRRLSAELIRLLLGSAMGLEIARQVSAFRALRALVREGFAGYESTFVSVDVLLTWGTTRFAAVPVRHDPRAAGRSNYTFLRLLGHALDVVTGFSTRPLQIASLVGFAFTLFGVGVLGWAIGRYLVLGYSFPGFPFLASVIAIFSGAQLFALGIIGEYLARMHFRSMGRPYSVVRQSIGFPPRGAPGG